MDGKQIKAFEELQKSIEEPLTPNTLIYIYQRIRILTEIPSKPSPLLNYPPLIKTLRFFLADRDREIRVAALRTLRYMAVNKEVLTSITFSKIQHFVVRCFETEGKNQEKIEACKFIKNWLEVSPNNFPGSFMNALIALADTENEELKEFAVEAIRILCVSNPKQVALHGGIKVLTNSLSDGQIQLETHINTILTITFLLNSPETRVYLTNYSEIIKIFAVFTNTDSIYGENEFNCLLALSKQVIKTMCRSWVGLFFLASKGFKLIFQCLVLPSDIKVKVAIIEILEELLNLPVETAKNRQVLLKNYVALLVKALLDSGLIGCLNGVIRSGGPKLAARCKGVYKKIFVFASDLLPPHTLGMFSILTPVSELPDIRVFVETEKNLNFLYLCCEYLSKEPRNYIEPGSSLVQKIYKKYFIDMLEGLTVPELVKSSRVVESLNKWNWGMISKLISVAEQKPLMFSQLYREKFFSTLLNYFIPSMKEFSALKYHPDNFNRATIGWRLFKLLLNNDQGIDLLTTPPAENFFLVRTSFINELKLYLAQENSSSRPNFFSPENVANTMVREYIKWISLLTHSKTGKTLLANTGLDMLLLNLSTIPHISSIILLYLDYSQPLSKDFISISLQSPSNTLKQISMQQIHLLHKAGNLDLSWSVKELVSLFYYPDHDTAKSALRIVKELCKDPNCLQAFIETGPQDLSKLGEEGKNCLISLLSSENGIRYLLTLNFIQNELENWEEHGHENYIISLEQKSECGLSFSSKNYALDIFTPFFLSAEEHSDGLWLSRIPFFIAMRVMSKSLTQVVPGVVQVEDDEIFIKSFDCSLALVEGDILELCLMVGCNFISNQGNECENGNWARFNLSTYEAQRTSGIVLHYSSENSLFSFKSCSFRVKVLPKMSQKIDFPIHLYGELVKTEIGLQFLKENIKIQQFVQCLRENQSTTCKRVALWALGNIGTSEIGAKYLKGIKAVEEMIKVAEESEILSLRGAAFQNLCLISGTKTGKKLIRSCGWVVSPANIAIPESTQKMFELKEYSPEWVFEQRALGVDEGVKRIKLNEDEMNVFDNLMNVSNFARKQEAELFIRVRRQQSPEVFENLRMFDAVMEYMGIFNFNLKTRKMLHKVFEKVHRKQGSLDELDRC